MPAYRIDHPGFDKPRAVEARSPRRARAYVAREFAVTRLNTRQVFELGEQGVELVDITTPRKVGLAR